MTRMEALEKLFAAEVGCAFGGLPLAAAAIPKKLRTRMIDGGDCKAQTITLSGWPPVKVEILTITHRGRMDYCATCKDEPEPAP
jgi:hypothetical protein